MSRVARGGAEQRGGGERIDSCVPDPGICTLDESWADVLRGRRTLNE